MHSIKGENKSNPEEWAAFRNEISDLFELFADGDLNSIDQKSFEEYLAERTNQYFHTPLTELSDLKFLFLEKIVDAWYYSEFGFDAFYDEKERRFSRHD